MVSDRMCGKKDMGASWAHVWHQHHVHCRLRLPSFSSKPWLTRALVFRDNETERRVSGDHFGTLFNWNLHPFCKLLQSYV